MDQLDTGILDAILRDDEEDLDINSTLRTYQLVMGDIITTNKPLSMTCLHELWIGEESTASVTDMLTLMGSLLSCRTPKSCLINLLHPSLSEFLKYFQQSHRYHVGAKSPVHISRGL
jgi:hypothetical protein